MVPVAMPGMAEGKVWRQVVCQIVAPSASDPCRISWGTARSASRVVMITTGRISSASAMAPPRTMPLKVNPTDP